MMSYPIDLSITGKPSPRIEHPRSAGKKSQTPFSLNKTKSLTSDIFLTGQIDRKSSSTNVRSKKESGRKEKLKATPLKAHQDEISSASVITKSALENVKELAQISSREEAEQFEYGLYQTARKQAPQGIPQLSLDEITGQDDLTYTKIKDDAEEEEEEFDGHGGWVVPKVERKSKSQAVKGGGWQVSQSRPSPTKTPQSRRPDDVPELDLKLSQSNVALEQMRETVKKIEEEKEIPIEYLGKLKNEKEIDNLKRLSREKKNQLFEEAILADQLANLQVKKNPCDATGANVDTRFDSRVRRHNDLYSSSTVTIGHEGDIKKRLQFTARLLTLSGYDARRELNGFFITSDNTVACYEFRQFGTRSKALPFIQRGSYRHVTGHRKGEPLHLLDIGVGKNLVFEGATQPNVPDTLKKNRKYVTLRITEVDETNRKNLLFDKCRTEKEKKEVFDFITLYETRERSNKVKALLEQIQGKVKINLGSCGEKVVTNLFRQFCTLDVAKTGLLKKELLIEQLNKFRINITDEEFHQIWCIADVDDEGVMDFGDFLRLLFGEMCEERKVFVRKAFTRLDPNKRGVGEINDIRKYFLPSKHPDVVSGKISESRLLDDFLLCFKWSKQKTELSYSEFECYYEGVSMGFTSDPSFINLVRLTWNV